MKKKAMSGIMLTLMLIGMLTLAFNIQSVKAEPKTWYVDDDGPADFSKIGDTIASPLVIDGDTIFVRSGTYHEHNLNVYKSLSLVGEHKETTIIDGDGFGPVVKIARFPPKPVNITGFTIQNGSQDWFYTLGSGVLLYYAESCNISDLIVSNSRYGITSYQGKGNTINGNTISDTNQGIPLYYSRNEVVVGNEISNGVQVGSDPPYGVQVWGGSDNEVIANTVTNISYTGIRLSRSATRTLVKENTVSNISEGIVAAYGASYYNSILDNTVSNAEWGIFFVDPSYYNTIAGNSITNSSEAAIYFNNPYNNTISSNTISESGYGIHFQVGGSDNTVIGNTILDSGDAIRLDYADNNFVTENNSTNNIFAITVGEESSDNTVEKNIASKSQVGILILQNSYNNKFAFNEISDNGLGIIAFGSNNNKFLQNRITHSDGQSLHLVDSNNSIVAGNDISNNSYDILLSRTENTTIYHNNFIDNSNQVYLYQAVDTKWDDGYPSGGNFWSYYTDVDLFNGPNQDLLGMDGIWDHPYVVDVDNRDMYPLVKPWPTIPATVDVDPDTLNLRSRGNWITAYIELPTRYDLNNIDVSTVTLEDTFSVDPNAPTQIGDHDIDGVPDLMVRFNRTQLESYIYHVLGIRYGSVTLKITGQLYDGTPFEGSDTIQVKFAGDVNNDGTINILDAAMVSAHWYPGPPIGPLGYDSNADFNKDGSVNILDGGILSVNWGQTVP